ncbi:hypothetical protein DFS34DRAFT_683393 [Phlyctochytrium arcticum]|nr:hypothetical protein DFS34DRAFT_683393 [Phlyctochytrium arcticum]
MPENDSESDEIIELYADTNPDGTPKKRTASHVPTAGAAITEDVETSTPERKKRKKQLRFDTVMDIALLKETAGHFPFGAGSKQVAKGWDKVAAGFNATVQKDLNGRGAKDRIDTLLKKHRTAPAKSASKSGTNESYDQQEELLTKLANKVDGYKAEKSATTAAEKKKKAKDEANSDKLMSNAMIALKNRAPAASGSSLVITITPPASATGSPGSKRRRNGLDSIQERLEKDTAYNKLYHQELTSVLGGIAQAFAKIVEKLD